jgi:transcriptional regulator with XRE-family HTH domain
VFFLFSWKFFMDLTEKETICMSEFARVLTEIIEQGKQERTFSIKELAQQAQITPSYLSNLKQSNRKPPAHKTLHKLTEGLRQLHVPESDIQQLIDAYNRQHFNYQEEGRLLESLIDEYKEEGTLFERVKQGVQTKGLVRKRSAVARNVLAHKPQQSGCFEGDHHAFITQAMTLLETVHERGDRGGKIYITWFHHDLFDEEFSRDRNSVRDMLRSFLWVDSPFQAFHLWAGDITRDITVIADFLAQYIGTSHCFLYEIPHGEHLPEYLVVEGVGFVEAKPVSANRYWIRHETVEPKESPQAAELQALIRYLEYLLGPPEQRKPLVKTNAPARKFSITPVTRKLADTETQNLKTELLLIKSSLSARFRPVEYLRAALETSGVPQDQIETYITHHLERVMAHEKRLQSGKERAIHEKAFLKKEFQDVLTHLVPSHPKEEDLLAIEARLLREQILQVLQTLTHHPNIHFALADQEFLIRFSLSGNTAFLSFDPPDTQGEPPLKRDDALVRAWTEHPDVVYQLRHEFNMIWKGIDPQWRTDTEQGRRNIIHFFMTEPLKALLAADLPEPELWTFINGLIDWTGLVDAESFIREVCTHEQGAEDLLILNNTFPLITLPLDVGPWDSRSSIRTRQLVFHALVREIKHVEFMLSQKCLETYWATGQYGTQTFPREWVVRHVQAFQALLLEFPEKITAAVIPQREQFPLNVEIINGEYVTFQKAETADEGGGIILHDRELAEMLRAYIQRNISSGEPSRLKGAKNVAKWLEKQFGTSKIDNSTEALG